MSDRSQLMYAHSIEPPETNDWDVGSTENIENRIDEAIYRSSAVDILDELGTSEFKSTWLILSKDIKTRSLKEQREFIRQISDKIFEIYDYEFPIKIDLDTEYDLNNFYDFLQFLEYDNIDFINKVWKLLGPKNLINFDIEKFCNENEQKIINEIEEQVNIYKQSKLIFIFLRTYYKEKMIEWFIKHTKKNKLEITINLLEGEKTNG